MRALLSVYDKTGVVELGRALAELGWDLASSGGTARALADAGVPVTDVADLTGFAPMLGHRVVTLHPTVHGGILADRDDPEHRRELDQHGIVPIDLVVSNLYPFAADPSIEQIDIGGPTLVRAAAKNHAHVGVVTDPADYEVVVEELRRDGALSAATRRTLARKAFAHTAAYDAAVVSWFDDVDRAEARRAGGPADPLPETVHLALERAQELRYGENPHQAGARYRRVGTPTWWDSAEQHSGLALSYLNIYDAEAAWRLVHDLAAMSGRPSCAIVKHANPCGAAVADDPATAYQRAFDGDPRSAFGGIVALDRPVDHATADAMVAAAQADVIVAPGWEEGTIDKLVAKRKNTRLLTAPPPEVEELELRQVGAGFLVQQAHGFAAWRDQWRVVTETSPTDAQWRDAELAWRLCGHTKSNAIVLVAGEMAVGIGAGQQSRVDAAELAARKAAGRARGGASASDAFYPFPDGVEAAIEAGVAVVVQPGGSVRDDDIIATCDAAGVAMVLTGERHFLH